jgi:uncharacterized Fe-S center protein
MATVSVIKATYSDLNIDTLLAPLGGMERFVKNNQKVLLKMNLLSGKKGPEKAVTTHPEFVRAVARAVRKAGGNPHIGDSPAGSFSKRSLTRAYKRSGIKNMAREEGIPALKMAKVRGLWSRRIDYPILGPEDVAHPGFRLPNTADHLLTGKKPPRKSPVITDKCTACGECERICPKEAVKVNGRMAEVTYAKCIRCFCCHEVCPEDAIVLRSVTFH